MDGSASPFVLLLQQAGIEEQAAPKRFMRVKRRVEVKDGDKWARLDPYEGYKLSFSIDFKHPVIERSHPVGDGGLRRDLVPEGDRARAHLRLHARGRGAARERPGARRRAGQRRGARRVPRAELPTGLRFADEFIRHKLLDAVGDLYLLGRPLLGAFSAHKSGHAINNQLLRARDRRAGALEAVTFERAEDAPAGVARLAAQFG